MNPDKKPGTVVITYIVTTPEKLWQALTTAEFSRQYFFGREMELGKAPGESFALRMDDGQVDCAGKILEYDPPRFLSMTWRVERIEEMRKLPEAIVTFKIDDLGGAVRLTVSEYHHESLDTKYLEGGRKGWPVILSGLKT